MNNAARKDNSYRLLTDHLMLTLMPRDALFYAIWCCSEPSNITQSYFNIKFGLEVYEANAKRTGDISADW